MQNKLWIICGAMLVMVGCGSDGGGGGPPAPPAPTTFTFNVVNNSGLTVHEFYLTPSTSSLWGPDQFSTDLASGSTRSITGVAPCGVLFDYLAINGTFTIPVVAWGPAFDIPMPACGGTYTLTLFPPA